MQYRDLGNTGLKVSALSFGASSLGAVFHDIDEKEGIAAVHTAIDRGINLIDVSPYYGLTKAENVLGKALRNIDRSKVILSTKAGRYGEKEFDFSAKRLVRSVEESLTRLQTDYIDILYLHDIEFVSDLKPVIEESVPTLNRLKEQGKIRFTGISGYPLDIFKIVLSKVPVDAILSYCHYSLNDTSLIDLLPFLRQKQAGLVNASPLSMGLLTSRGAPAWHPAGPVITDVCREAADYCLRQGEDLAKLAIQFSTANEQIPTTLVSTANPGNIAKNIEWADEPLNEQLLKEVQSILRPIMNATWPSGNTALFV